MSSFVHISQFHPEKSRGGVAQFARDLKTVVPDLRFEAMEGDWRKTGTFKYVAGSDDIVIADGYYGYGYSGVAKRLITVCHSTYAGWIRDTLINPQATSGVYEWLLGAESLQERAYKESDELVAVSSSAQEELWTFYQLDSTLIRNGVDPNYIPFDGATRGTICEVAGQDINKGADVINELRNKAGFEIDNLGFEGGRFDRWEPYEIAVLPSRHEGGPYAQLEAMAMNKKIVAYRSGFFKHEVPEKYFWGTYDLFWMTFQRLISDALVGDNPNPREWILNNATLEMFQENWRKLLYEDQA